MEYRFIGRHLILLDAHAHLIVDFIDDAFPIRATESMMRTRVSACPSSCSSCMVASGAGCRERSRPAPAIAGSQAQPPRRPPSQLPQQRGSFKFAVLGDFGTGEPDAVRARRARWRSSTSSSSTRLVILVGDNLYGSERPQDFKKKFEIPYKPLLDAGVKFYASLGNHDSREQRFYKLFNMDGKLYYTFKPHPNVRFFVLDSTYPAPEQIEWLEKELQASTSDWKIAFFHHPLYSSGGRHGSDLKLRDRLEPLFVKYNVSVVFTGHDHFYERVKPQNGIVYFVAGSGGKLREGNLDRDSGITAKGFDTDLAFMAAEITGDKMYFNAVKRSGTSSIRGRSPAATPARTSSLDYFPVKK